MSYFKLGDAFRELTSAIGAKDTAIAGAKLVGKTLFTAGELTTKLAFEIVKQAPGAVERSSSEMLKRKDLTDEQREKAEGIHARAKEMVSDIRDTRLDEINAEINGKNKSLNRLAKKWNSNHQDKTNKRMDEISKEIDLLESEKRSLESDKRWS